MIRLLIAVVMVLMAGNANAVTNEYLLKDCRKYVENNFLTRDSDSISCFVYFAALRDVLADICDQYKQNYSSLNGSHMTIFDYVAVDKDVSLDSAIQHYVNEMQKRPQAWKLTAGRDVKQSLQDIAPCKPE